jgi:protein O-GlcNAc transferase
MSDVLLRNANSLLGLGRQREALGFYERYLDGNPQSAEAWHNRATALAQLKQYDEALVSYDRALVLAPNSAQTWNNRGNVLVQNHRYAEAPAAYDKALALDPYAPYARGCRLLSKLWCCDWHGLAQARAEIEAGVRAGQRVVPPFGGVMILTDPADLARAARIWMAGRHGAPAPLWRGETYRNERIRVAYLSGDLRDHPVAHLMAGVFEHHDRAAFETMAVSFGPDDGSEVRARIAGASEHFVDAHAMRDFEIASLLRERKTDIAIDLMGLTADCRSGILAHRAAPVQVNYLGYPGTMSAPYMDYILADRTVLPEDDQRFYAEKAVYLPDTYMATDSAHAVFAKPGRAEAGLPETGFVFCSFNNALKFAPETFSIWMRLLQSVAGSVLWLPQGNAAACEALKREASACGAAPERLVFAPYMESRAGHLARLSLADLFLDTLPCNAHTTAVDALWAGVPVLTCVGSTFPGRVAASLLQAVGVPELVTRSLPDYEGLAVRLAREPSMLSHIRARLAGNRETTPLFDTARFTRHLEAAYREMAARRARNEIPSSFAVERMP